MLAVVYKTHDTAKGIVSIASAHHRNMWGITSMTIATVASAAHDAHTLLQLESCEGPARPRGLCNGIFHKFVPRFHPAGRIVNYSTKTMSLT